MISKSLDSGSLEWDQQLPLLLFAYRSTAQESTKESPFFLLYGRDPRLPTGSELSDVEAAYLVDMDDYRTEFLVSLAKAQKIALEKYPESPRETESVLRQTRLKATVPDRRESDGLHAR